MRVPGPMSDWERCTSLEETIERMVLGGYALDALWPADAPHSAILSGHGEERRITERAHWARPEESLPAFIPEAVFSEAGEGGDAGRAGMVYRDLVPSRLGGFAIASHIKVADGPVADWVHYHRLVFQLIAVRRGWVRVVYEGQGVPFVMQAGDMVLQPPGIRHRVLEAGGHLEVVEISGPAEHETWTDRDLVLPGGTGGSERVFGGQHFARFIAADAEWTPWNGGEVKNSGIGAASAGAIDARLVRKGEAPTIDVPACDGFRFAFVLEGSAKLAVESERQIRPADSFVIRSGDSWRLRAMSDDFILLDVDARVA